MDAALICLKEVNSFFKLLFHTQKTLTELKETIKVKHFSIPVYYLPVYKNEIKPSVLQKFIAHLKKENIQKVLCSTEFESYMDVKKEFEKTFETFQGNYVINYKNYDIIKKYLKEKGKEPENSSVLIMSEHPQDAEKFILKLYKHVKKIEIFSENQEMFTSLTENFIEEYGLYIKVCSELKKEYDLIIHLNEEKVLNEEIIYLGKNTSLHPKILFQAQKELNFFTKYENIDQKVVEFLIYQRYKSLDEQTIRRFFKEYFLRICKIKNND